MIFQNRQRSEARDTQRKEKHSFCSNLDQNHRFSVRSTPCLGAVDSVIEWCLTVDSWEGSSADGGSRQNRSCPCPTAALGTINVTVTAMLADRAWSEYIKAFHTHTRTFNSSWNKSCLQQLSLVYFCQSSKQYSIFFFSIQCRKTNVFSFYKVTSAVSTSSFKNRPLQNNTMGEVFIPQCYILLYSYYIHPVLSISRHLLIKTVSAHLKFPSRSSISDCC